MANPLDIVYSKVNSTGLEFDEKTLIPVPGAAVICGPCGDLTTYTGSLGGLTISSSWASSSLTSSYVKAVGDRIIESKNSAIVLKTTGSSTLLGEYAGQNIIDLSNTTCIGCLSGQNATTSSNATFIGRSAGCNATTASHATIIGRYAGYNATNATNATMVGSSAGYNAQAGRNSIFIGCGADAVDTSSNVQNSIVIGYGQKVNAPNTTIIGNSGSTNTQIYGLLNATGSLLGTSSYALSASSLVGGYTGVVKIYDINSMTHSMNFVGGMLMSYTVV